MDSILQKALEVTPPEQLNEAALRYVLPRVRFTLLAELLTDLLSDEEKEYLIHKWMRGT